MNKEEIQYIYSGRFDAAFLDELYGDDIQSAAEIFESSLNLIVPEMAAADEFFYKADLESLRKLFHKIKPLFGYVGLLKLQALVQKFEDSCATAANTEELRSQYQELSIMVTESVSIIRQELIRMKTFINVRA